MKIIVYAICDDNTELEDLYPPEMTDKDFIKESIRQGLYYSLDEFQEAFNTGAISDQWYIRIIKKETYRYA